MSKQGFVWIVSFVCIFGQFCARAAGSPSALIPGDLLVLNKGLTDAQILEIDPKTGIESVWESGGYLDQPTDMVFDASGNVIVSDYDNGIIRINPSTGQQTQVAAGNYVVGTNAVSIDKNGNYVACDTPDALNAFQFPQSVNVVRIDPATGAQTLLTSAISETLGGYAILSNPVDSTVDPDGNIIVSNAGGIPEGGVNGILKIHPTNGNVSVVSSGNNFAYESYPNGILLDSENSQNLWAICQGLSPSLLDVNTVTGEQTVISSGGLLGAPGPIAEDDDGNLLIANAAHFSPQTFGLYPATIVSVDPVTGSQTLVFTESTGGDLFYPKAILMIPEPSTVTGCRTCRTCEPVKRENTDSHPDQRQRQSDGSQIPGGNDYDMGNEMAGK